MPRQVSKLFPIRTARIAALLIIIIGLFLLVNPAAAQEIAFTINVEGVGTATSEPNLATVDLGVAVVGTDLQAALSEVAAKTSAIKEALLELDSVQSDIWTVADSVTPEDIIDPATGAVTGALVYHVRSVLRVTVTDLSEVRNVINTGVSSGANIVENMTMGVADLNALEREARQAAIANAYVRAQALAAGFNLVLSDPIIITETLDNDGLPFPFAANIIRAGMFAPAEGAGSTSPLLLTVRVQVVFRTQRPTSGS